MNFCDAIDDYIVECLNTGGLPTLDPILEVEVPGQQPGPGYTPSVGPVGSSQQATFQDSPPAPVFRSASMGTVIPPAMFPNQNFAIPPALFSGATQNFGEDVVSAVLQDFQTISEDKAGAASQVARGSLRRR